MSSDRILSKRFKMYDRGAPAACMLICQFKGNNFRHHCKERVHSITQHPDALAVDEPHLQDALFAALC